MALPNECIELRRAIGTGCELPGSGFGYFTTAQAQSGLSSRQKISTSRHEISRAFLDECQGSLEMFFPCFCLGWITRGARSGEPGVLLSACPAGCVLESSVKGSYQKLQQSFYAALNVQPSTWQDAPSHKAWAGYRNIAAKLLRILTINQTPKASLPLRHIRAGVNWATNCAPI